MKKEKTDLSQTLRHEVRNIAQVVVDLNEELKRPTPSTDKVLERQRKKQDKK